MRANKTLPFEIVSHPLPQLCILISLVFASSRQRLHLRPVRLRSQAARNWPFNHKTKGGKNDVARPRNVHTSYSNRT